MADLGSRSTEIQIGQSNRRKPPRTIKMQIALNARRTQQLITLLIAAVLQMALIVIVRGQQAGPSFPGVTRDLASFCSARPSLSIDLAPMIVHVKRNTSFNYKLYLFSQDEHVFQTGQIIPRDDFRVHSFPVKLKHLDEFMHLSSGNNQQDANQSNTNSKGLEVYQLIRDESGGRDAIRRDRSRLKRVPNSRFDSRRFFERVQLVHGEQPDLEAAGNYQRLKSQSLSERKTPTNKLRARALPFDVQGDALPGDDDHHANHHNEHDAALASNQNANEHIEFDRDDQLAILGQPASHLRELNRRHVPRANTPPEQHAGSHLRHHQSMVMPVGSFSAFRVNFTYLARKDFDQMEAELIRLQVDARNFQVERIDLLRPVLDQQADDEAGRLEANSTSRNSEEDLSEDDYAFLSHRLLRDRNVRLTSISQIYEDWITRNHYTIVYIQRRLIEPTSLSADADELEHEDIPHATDRHRAKLPKRQATRSKEQQVVVTERLIFRGSSIVLLGADQLDYHVKASAFITEKNGLHYFLEFLPNGKFHLGAIDWSKRPFKFIDSQRFPIKPTRTQFDNEELLLCPPSVCYSEQPIDELVAYGRVPLPVKLQSEATILSKSSSSTSSTVMPPGGGALTLTAEMQQHRNNSAETTTSHQSESISLDNLIEAVRTAAAARLDLRLHLRDWTWQLSREPNRPSSGFGRFVWHYERARRNDLKAVPDTYGFALVGHEIDAAYRVFNELYLISAGNLIGIDYTLPNETTTSVRPIGDEFPGLGSNLLDPITGAFYDRYSNQIYFFKGDRYVGYDYATKKPLEDFLLPPAVDDALGGLSLALLMQAPGSGSQPSETNNRRGALVSSLPVVEILGQQHQVDAIYHDLGEDLVYVFSGMKFYTLRASDFKDGTFRHNTASKFAMQCINEHFLVGCRFDAAYPNPCSSDQVEPASEPKKPSPPITNNPADDERRAYEHENQHQPDWRPRLANNFSEEQQIKLRTIAARGGATVGLMDFLLENTLVAQGAGREPAARLRTADTEQIVVYLLVAMVLVTILVTVAMIMVILNWARLRTPQEHHDDRNKSAPTQRDKMAAEGERRGGAAQRMTERLAYPPAIAHYLSSQYQQQQQHPHRPPSLGGYFYNGPPPGAATTGSKRLGNYAAAVGPLTAPPTLPPPPAPRRSELADSSMF